MRSVVWGGGRACLKQNLFHSRMIRPVVGGGGRTCLKHLSVIRKGQKKISTKGHEERRRATKGLEKAQEGSAKGREGGIDFHEGR